MKNGRQPKSRLGIAQLGCKLQFEIILQGWRCGVRGVVVRERGGKYFGAGTALRQILLATGGTLTLKRSGKSRRTS